ncbi:MAG TPA: methionine biosynthesis protein MetW [Burkholderiales bacterium]|nr:methionine biosynthesis protein MetW [Burkholderiales bacterium]
MKHATAHAVASGAADHRLVDRPEFEAIAAWIEAGAQVLDLGCGDGSLLRYLKDERGAMGYGIEIDDANILASVRNGVNVLQSNLESGLAGFESGSFDYVVLSQTLQAVRHTEQIIGEMLRVGRQGIVTFPNFGYWRHRLQVMRGRMPVSSTLPFEWYDTPNVHLFTIRDFETFCAAHAIRILERVVIDQRRRVSILPNLMGSLAVYRFDRGLGHKH